MTRRRSPAASRSSARDRLALDQALRRQLARILDWGDAHASFEDAVRGVPAALRGRRARGLPWSAWELLEHIRLAQRDILDFCRDADYRERKWPDDYWPPDPAPPGTGAWARSVAAARRDRAELAALGADPEVDLLAPIPHGSGQTVLREILLAADHAAYHLGQIVAVRRALGCWRR